VARRTERAERANLLSVPREYHGRPQVLRALGVIGVRVRQHNALDAVASRRTDGLEMLGVSGPWVDHPAPDQIRVGAVEGQWRGVGGTNPDDAWRVTIGLGHRPPLYRVSSRQVDSQTPRMVVASERGVFLLALAAVCIVAALEAALGARPVLAELLLAGPLIAALGASGRQACAVAVLALAAAIALGWASDAFGSAEHVASVIAVAVGGLLAVVVASTRSRRSEGARMEGEREELLRLERLARRDASQARDQLEAILRGVADAVTAQGPDGRLLFANDAAVETLGYESSEALLAASNTQILDRFEMLDEHGDPFPLEQLPGRRALESGEGGQALVRFRVRETGEERWAAVKSTPIRDAEGRIVMAINVTEDLTAHKRAELAQRFLAESSSVLGSSLDPDEVLREVAALTVPHVADWCAIDLRDANGGIHRVALAHTDPGMVDRLREMARRYPPDPDAPRGVPHVLRTGSPELYEEVSDARLREAAVDAEHHRLLAELRVRSAMVVPMIARSRTIGALSLATGPSGRRFDRQDLELGEELARRCASAVDNARLYRERAYIARTLQQSLLPIELPDIPGIEVAARFRPTGEGNEVGGDFYDVFKTGGRGWTVVIGDVCGKGPDAAAVTALARYTLRTAAMGQSVPSRSLNVLNEALLRQREDRRFCTVAYAYLELLDGGGRMGIASGGHPLPLLLHPDGRVEPIGVHGTLLGVVPDPRLEDRAVSISRGDAIVFYTDGVVECRSGGGVLDETELAALLSGCAGRGADTIAGMVEDAALHSQGGGPRDDIAVLVLRVAG
jgi:PAS domain S-box-containing protein